MATPIDVLPASTTASPSMALLRLLHLTSPALPVGAFAYSQGLEYAVERGWVNDEDGAAKWIGGLLRNAMAHTDAPLLYRLHRAWFDNNETMGRYWNDYLLACRESAELQQEDIHMGGALMRLLKSLGVVEADDWLMGEASYAAAFSLAAVRWGIGNADSVMGYLWAWSENQVAAAIKLVPLGQTSGQRILQRLLPSIVESTHIGMSLADDDIGLSSPALAMASALHETQYSRLFRS